jgi:predicted O-methyltransferase YrrM
MSLTTFLKGCGFNSFEGHCQDIPKQVFDLIRLTKSPVTKVMEIGFGAGHSAEIFLRHNPKVTLTSFDIGKHSYVLHGKQYIDKQYPNRHTLVLGDSMNTLPEFIAANPTERFDLILLDASHDMDSVRSYMEQIQYLSTKDTIVIMDDVYWPASATTKIWNEYVEKSKIIEMDRKTYQVGRAMTWGKFVEEKTA